MEWFQNIFGKTQFSQPSNLVFGSIALKGKSSHVLTAKSEFSVAWIIDLEASDHMIGETKLLTNV